MYQYIIDDKTSEDIKKLTESTKSILEQFSDVDKKYSTNTDKIELNLQKLKYETPTAEQIKADAENSLKSYKNESIKGINEDYLKKSQNIDKSIEEVKTTAEERKNNIIDTYENIKENAANDAIKRGLARSSIIVNKLDNYNNGMLNELSILASKSNDQLSLLNTQKSTLELEKEGALNAFDIEYAVKIQDKIKAINDQIAKNEEAVIKYNNEIAQLEAKWQKEQEEERLKNAMSEAEYFSKYGTYVIDSIKNKEKYEIAKNYFSNLDKTSALIELTNNSIYKENLGESYYKKLLQELNSKQ